MSEFRRQRLITKLVSEFSSSNEIWEDLSMVNSSEKEALAFNDALLRDVAASSTDQARFLALSYPLIERRYTFGYTASSC